MVNVRDILNHKGRDVQVISPEESSKTALKYLTEKNIGALPVVEKEGELIGIFTERDFVHFCAIHEDPDLRVPVRDVMSREVVCINEKQTIENCMILMTTKKIRHLPVLRDNEIIGIVSIGDVVNSAIHEKDLLIDQLEHYIAGSLY